MRRLAPAGPGNPCYNPAAMSGHDRKQPPGAGPRRWRRRFIVLLLLLGVLAIVGLLGCLERFAFLPVSGAPSPTPGEVGWGPWKDTFFTSRDGTRLHGWVITGQRPPTQEAGTVVIHAHGNGGNLGYQLFPPVGMCLEFGCDVLMFDYRSFGLSDPGSLNRFTVVEDLAGAIVFARARYPTARLLVLGQSIGGATAALAMREAALRDAIDGLCLVSAFADWNVEVCDALKSNPFTWLLAYPLGYLLVSPWRAEPVDGLAQWPPEKPLLLIHGKADRVVPVHHLDLFLAGLSAPTRAAVQVVRLRLGAHNALAASPEQGEEDVRSAVGSWITRANTQARSQKDSN